MSEIMTSHFPFARSESALPEVLPKDVPIIIEGVFPAGDEEMIEEEVDLVQKNYF